MTDPSVSLSLPVAADHPAYAGHFPGRPILPGVVLLDMALRALAARQVPESSAAEVRSAKFPSPVEPGEALSLRYAETARGVFRFEVRAGERVAASGVLALTGRASGAGVP
jgi:3-hydroxyacyl-[acyl-carrier-protein] dehydratase